MLIGPSGFASLAFGHLPSFAFDCPIVSGLFDMTGVAQRPEILVGIVAVVHQGNSMIDFEQVSRTANKTSTAVALDDPPPLR